MRTREVESRWISQFVSDDGNEWNRHILVLSISRMSHSVESVKTVFRVTSRMALPSTNWVEEPIFSGSTNLQSRSKIHSRPTERGNISDLLSRTGGKSAG